MKHRDEFNWTGFDITAFRNAGDTIGKMWTPSYNSLRAAIYRFYYRSSSDLSAATSV